MSFFKKKHTDAVIDPQKLPKHIGIIMDGNGRWAKRRGLPRRMGHAEGAKVFKNIARYCNKIGIEVLTVYAFSTENWKRPQSEIDNLMSILKDYLIDARDNLEDENIAMRFIGDLTPFDDELTDLMNEAEERTKNDTGLTCNIALNYGGRQEIVHSFGEILKNISEGTLSAENINEDTISQFMYTSGQPDPDLIIRPSGEYRLSNFMIWQAAYSEFWYSDVLWPDFTEKDLDRALVQYAKRQRRFGGV